ncbi:predicted protein [Sparassis crispa]|uniref:Zn(2)-C6 fungal-type domain-containing protein n=1 Tax=Sparassis crispa TaxID=139825 RepID=A0A401H104_9APHY|nr:predicted protein [Sparassis crispa]GBE88069.1 predicted protein [Sparassis crispa]
MSSQDEDNENENLNQGKKRRVQRACDVCRRKKIRCDGSQMPNNRCSNCVTYNYECTYMEAAKKRGPPKGYVESLEMRLEKMEKLLKKLCPDADFTQELGGHFDKEAWLTERVMNDKNCKVPYKTTPPTTVMPASTSTLPDPASPATAEDLDPSDDETLITHNIRQSFGRMSLNKAQMRFFGKSSSIMFIQTAMDLKHEYTGVDTHARLGPASHPGLLHNRPQYWTLHPWSSSIKDEPCPYKDFPGQELMNKLIEHYFVNVNEYAPLLHRPSFEEGIKNGLHLTDEGFGSTVLLVCAIGARFSSDPRVFLADYKDETHSAGWKWFQQVQMIRKSLLAPPRLYDLQIYALAAIFLQGTSAPQACWTMIGVGIRLAQDVGAHRRKVYNPTPTVDEELWKRAFWVLVSMDRTISMNLGRPCAIQDEDFDLDLPLECDDEYWMNSDPKQAFKQPADKPSRITFFNCLLRLNQILAFALRTIYSINKSKALLGFVGQQWEQHIVAELDSALNKWIDSVPDHLRWDPNRENITFLNQSAHLYASYYQLQIVVHRPFIPTPRKPSPLSFPSLAICTNAARSCTHVLDIQYQRTGMVMFANQMAVFKAGIVLLLNIWGGKRSGIMTDPEKEMADVHKCMKMLKVLEPRWHTAGRLWDILYELATVGDLPLPQPTPPTYKRERDADSPISVSSAPSPATSSTVDTAQRTIAGSKRVSRDATSATSAASPMFTQGSRPTVPLPPDVNMMSSNAVNTTPFDLPIHSDELGRLPLHPGCNAPSNTNSIMPMNNGWYNAASTSTRMSSMPTSLEAGSSTSAIGVPPMDTSLDPAIASMFAMQPNSVYDQMFSALQAPLSPAPQDYRSHVAASGMHDMDPMASMPNGRSYPDNTLAMWSSAPSGFEWDDWGTYITNVSGSGNQMNSSRPPDEG